LQGRIKYLAILVLAVGYTNVSSECLLHLDLGIRDYKDWTTFCGNFLEMKLISYDTPYCDKLELEAARLFTDNSLPCVVSVNLRVTQLKEHRPERA